MVDKENSIAEHDIEKHGNVANAERFVLLFVPSQLPLTTMENDNTNVRLLVLSKKTITDISKQNINRLEGHFSLLGST